MADTQSKILFALGEQPNLSTEQLNRLVDGKLNTTQKLLKRMWDRQLVVPKPLPNPQTMRGVIYSWRIKGSKAEALREPNYKHELACNDVYVSVRKLGQTMVWTPKDDQKNGFSFDRGLEIFGRQFYFEIERGTQTVQDIQGKVEAYLKLAGRFHVVFTVQDYQPNPFEPVKKTAHDYGAEILGLLGTYRRGAQFLVTPHATFVEDPLGQFLVSPWNSAFGLNTLP